MRRPRGKLKGKDGYELKSNCKHCIIVPLDGVVIFQPLIYPLEDALVENS